MAQTLYNWGTSDRTYSWRSRKPLLPITVHPMPRPWQRLCSAILNLPSSPECWRCWGPVSSAQQGQAKRPHLCPHTHQIHHDVFIESVPPLSCHAAHVYHGLWVVCVHMEDGCVDHAGHIGGVWGRAGHPGVCGEANLQKQEPLRARWAASPGRPEGQGLGEGYFASRSIRCA